MQFNKYIMNIMKLCSSKIGILHIWNDEHIESNKTNCINPLTLIGKILS